MSEKLINLKNPMFEEALKALEIEIERVIDKVYENDFEAGDITLKLNLSLMEGYKEFPKVGELGFTDATTVFYKKPHIEYAITSQLRKQFKTSGSISPEAEIKKTENNFVLEPVEDPQINMLEEDIFN